MWNDGFLVEVSEVREDPRFEFGLGCDADAAEQGPRQLGEEAFHEIEPRFGVNTKVKRPSPWVASQALVSLET